MLVVDVVAQLVEQRPQEGAEGDDPAVARRPHPQLDPRRPALVPRVEAVQLAPARRGADGEDLEAHRAQPEVPRKAEGEAARRRLDLPPVLPLEGLPQAFDQRAEPPAWGRTRDGVASLAR